jgi:hypothetical protein
MSFVGFGNQRSQFSCEPDRAGGAAPATARPAGALVSPAAVLQRHAGVMFEYQGPAAMTVVSPLTGRTYRFVHPGARIAVDPRDTPWLTFTPDLARVG